MHRSWERPFSIHFSRVRLAYSRELPPRPGSFGMAKRGEVRAMRGWRGQHCLVQAKAPGQASSLAHCRLPVRGARRLLPRQLPGRRRARCLDASGSAHQLSWMHRLSWSGQGAFEKEQIAGAKSPEAQGADEAEQLQDKATQV